MTKHWALYILAAMGLTALALYIYRNVSPKPPASREPIVSVTIDDPGMEYAPQFTPAPISKPLWDPTWIGELDRSLTTTYVQK